MDNAELVIGNHDSITLYGAEAQSELRDVTNNISKLLINDYYNLRVDFDSIINELEKKFDEKKDFLIQKIPVIDKYGTKKIASKYIKIFEYMDNVALQLQLQEAYLLKNTKILEQEDQILKNCIENLEQDICLGKNVLLEVQNARDDHLVEWTMRLQRKMQDLETTRIVSQQSRKQLQLMCMNNRNLIDKIIAILSNTLPLWRNQISLYLGVEENNQMIKTQEKIGDILVKVQKGESNSRINQEMLKALDNKLSASLKELESLENKEHTFRINLAKKLS